ncbi:MAG: serine acetyltransferase [Chitinophagaceae bacterium]|nr:serine acetyltransferase [Chitinophagaceae bacterium]MCW5927716.1 serine acetyltransferase [Chitinophagaceae bacterium]
MLVKNNISLLRHIIQNIHDRFRSELHPIPHNSETRKWINNLFAFLFPMESNKIYKEHEIEQLQEDLRHLLFPVLGETGRAGEIIDLFFEKLPDIYEELHRDAIRILHFDPAAHSIEEVLAAYPGFFAIAIHRFSHELYLMKVPVLPRLFSEYAHSVTGIDINPGATIGKGFFIDHGTGVVIGETCIIGNNVKIYQGVTLGALSVSKELADVKRHPTVEDNVIIYSGTTILGGNTIIGRDSIIGGNVWLTESVPPYSLVYHKSEVKVRSNTGLEGIDFVI